MHSYPLKYYRLKGANNGKTSVVTAVTPTWGANLCILWIFYLTLLTYFRFSCITIVNFNKKTHKWNMSMKKALSIFNTLLYRSIENQYQFRFFFRKVIEWLRCLTYMYLSIKRNNNNDALKRWSNADFRFSDSSVCLTIDFLRIKLKQIRDFPLFSRLDVLKTVKIGKIVFTYPFYSSFVFYSKSLFEPWFNINIRFHILFPLSSTYVKWIEKGVKVWRNKSNVDYL